jgi:protein subunit release factor B
VADLAGACRYARTNRLLLVWRMLTCRAGGPGGLRVNTSATAVIIHHRPSGLIIRSDGERSQHANKRTALARLASILAQQARSTEQETQAAIRHSHYQLVRGAPVCTWRGDPLQRSE